MSDLKPLPDGQVKLAAELLKVLSHPTRLRLANHLMNGEASVAEMERVLDVRQPSLSQHLGELRVAGMASTRREHKLVFYTLTDPRAIGLLSSLPAILGHEGPRQLRRPTTPPHARHGGAAMFAIVGDSP
jgi:DNA-binding transcriptional ArsR family regulator